jgi:hypothetical protein
MYDVNILAMTAENKWGVSLTVLIMSLYFTPILSLSRAREAVKTDNRGKEFCFKSF